MARAETLLPIRKNVALASYLSNISNSFSVYGPGPSSKVRAIVLFATVGVGAAGVGFGFSAGLGILASFRAVGFCRYLETEEIGTVIVNSPYDDGSSDA